MAFGFGFNREKLLASAEKYVQQGKLQNAIGEYQKIIQEDPKDLTVLNTVGDLCARIGQNDQAAIYFRKAGDHYAHDGFTVKAIAIYKKLTRLNPGEVEHVNKLAELYTQQGLITDARAQYMQVADHCLKSGDTAGGARVLQRILELDPENTATKSKLAELYLKLGKKDEARQIYFTAAEALYARGSYQAADEALERVIKMDPHHAGALLLRGMVAVDSGDSVSAVGYLEKVSDLDSRPDALRALLRAKIESDSADGLEHVASKLLTAHGDVSGIREAASWFGNHNRFAEALRLYEIHAGKLLSGDRNAYLENLYALIPKIRNDREALGIMMRLLESAQDSSHVAELMELQAHASVQKGEFQEARDLYQKLSDLEPDNSLHQQNYKQMQSKLGEDSASRSLSPEEAQQAFMVEALEEAAPAFHEHYDPTVEKAIEAALTDAELFVSYNVPTKAIPPLEAVLPMAPRDVTVNQRLATLYARNGRFADAARSCETLSEIYRERGHEKEAAQYLDAAQTYALRAPKGSVTLKGIPTAEASPETPTIEIEVPGEQGAPSVQEFSFDVPDHLTDGADEKNAAPAQPIQEIKIEAPGETGAIAEPPTHAVQEVDVSNEWENMLTVEGEAPPAIDVPAQDHVADVAAVPVEVQPAASAADSAAEKIQEIQFYINQEMWDLAKKAILDLTEIAPDAAEITKLISAVSAGQSRAARASAPAPVPAIPIEPPQPDPKAARRSVPAVAQPVAAAVPAESPSATPEFVIAPVQVSGQPSKKEKQEKDSPLEEVLEEPKAKAAAAKAKAVSPPAVSPSKPAKPVLEESPLDELLTEAPPVAPAKAKKDEKKPAAKAKNEASTEDILDEFVGDLEKTDLVDFVPRPKAEQAKPAAVTAPAKVSPSAPAAAAAAAAPVPEVRTSRNGDMRDAEANSLLTDILSELQEETIDSAAEEGDPDTHYNLGIAFKEMGLLDEAIGELQKVCHAIDRGHPFSQPIQAYTWLAQCLVDKGAPEAAVRWYQRALKLSGLDDASRCAIYYDLAAAYEASGDVKSALASFMEVYGSNIDFRDVASRIKALKS